MSEKAIIFTGGGSGGHVVPAITLIQDFIKKDFKIFYIGSYEGIEKQLTKGFVSEYFGISTGKLRRYIDLENLKDCFRIIAGFFGAFKILKKIKRKNIVLVSMGGFVSVPVVLAARILGIKIVIHEQTTRVGLANKICSIFATKVFVSFKDSLQFFPKSKTSYSGYPIREDFYSSSVNDVILGGINLKEAKLPILFVTGGGNGSKLLNDKIKNNLAWLCERYFVVHQIGQFAVDEYKGVKFQNYIALPFIGPEIIDIYKLAKIIISRSGAGTVCEIMALGKKSIFIPLKIAQKNEQYFNAMAAKEELDSVVITEDEFRNIDLTDLINNFEKAENRTIENAVNGKEVLVSEIIKLMN